MTDEIEVVVGIDCGIDKHQYQISTKDGEALSKGPLLNSTKAARGLVKRIDTIARKENVLIGMEATNTYHLCLQNYLVSNGYRVIVINPLKTSAYKQIDDYNNKTDPIDANGICQFLIDGKHKKIKQLNQKYLLLRELCRCWQKLKGDKIRTAVRLHSRLIVTNPEFREYFCDPFCESGVYILENYPTPEELANADVNKLQKELDKISHGFGKKDTAARIVNLTKESFGVNEDTEGYQRYMGYQLEEYKFLKKKIQEIKSDIRKEARKDYCRKEIDIIASADGVGIEVSAGILSELGDVKNFEKVSSILRFAGMIVLHNQSGKTDGQSKLSKLGSKYLRGYLHQAVMGAKLHSATFAAIYANKSMKIKDLDPVSKKVAKAKIRSSMAAKLLKITGTNLLKNRKFNDQIAFDSIQIDDFVRETVAVQFKKELADAAVQ